MSIFGYRIEEDFAKGIFGGILDAVIEWVADKLSPEDVFSESQLEAWAGQRVHEDKLMCMSEWARRNNKNIKQEVLYAARILERYGFIFGVDFDVATAIDKVSKVLADHADEDEALLKENKQIADKVAVDEPLIQDRRTFTRSRQPGWWEE